MLRPVILEGLLNKKREGFRPPAARCSRAQGGNAFSVITFRRDLHHRLSG